MANAVDGGVCLARTGQMVQWVWWCCMHSVGVAAVMLVGRCATLQQLFHVAVRAHHHAIGWLWLHRMSGLVCKPVADVLRSRASAPARDYTNL